MTVQIVEIAGQKMAMLPVVDYERLLDLLEDQSDLNAAKIAEQRRLDGEEYLLAAMFDEIASGASALRVWRNLPGFTLKALSEAVDCSIPYLSEIERGNSDGNVRLWGRLAAALNVQIEDILPE